MPDKSSTVTDDMLETKERHRRYLRAVNSPVRRNILRSIDRGNVTVSAISEDTDLDQKSLKWHLSILVDGFCVEKKIESDEERYSLTKEGKVVDFLDK